MGDGRFFWVPNIAPGEGRDPTQWKLQVGKIRLELVRRQGDMSGWWAEAKYLCGGAGIIYDRKYFREDVAVAKDLAWALVVQTLRLELDEFVAAQIRELVFSEEGLAMIPPEEKKE